MNLIFSNVFLISDETFTFFIPCFIYSGSKYNLFEHNCNTFSNEVAEFLTSQRIPSYILDLPQEVLNT